METLEAIRTLRAIRRFADRPIDDEKLRRILEAGRRAPSSQNQQRREFVVLRDRDRLRALAGTGRYVAHVAEAAAAVALVTPDVSRLEEVVSIMLDAGQAVENMLLAAWDQGLAGVHAGFHDHPELRRLLGYPDDRRCDYVLSFGYPADEAHRTRRPRSGGRRPQEALVHQERW